MAAQTDSHKLSSPQTFLWRMIVFLIIAGFIAAILYPQVHSAFMSNPGLNGLIIGVLLIGIAFAFRMVIRLFPEVHWVNSFRVADPGLELTRSPVLLAPMAMMLRDRIGRMMLSAPAMRSILDSISMRLDEARDISRYLIGLLVFLGLLGTFWGLLQTVSSVGQTIASLDAAATNTGVIFEDLKAGLQAPLAGMGTAFSSSLFGLAGSLVLGFLDLQASQAQNRFYNDLEDWLSTVTDLTPAQIAGEREQPEMANLAGIQKSIEQLARSMSDGGGPTRGATAAMAQLAEGIQSLIQHMRAEQQMIREWVEAQADQQQDVKRMLSTLGSRAKEREKQG
ncbi:MAG: flagellar motor protein MotA [Hyphomicrobiales bacterium]|nr:flagellar motor protein MotA [Hyphomicrobiales bacterium]